MGVERGVECGVLKVVVECGFVERTYAMFVCSTHIAVHIDLTNILYT